MMKALTFSVFGTADVLEYRDVPDPQLHPGEVLLEMHYIGLNFADIYRRKGNYHLAGEPPYIAGYEGAGIILEANGHPVYRAGDRVAFADVPFANAEKVAVPFTQLIPLPGNISLAKAAAVLLQGMTAQYLAADSHAVKAGEIAVVHAAAGGVGQLLVQLCKMKGAGVIGLTTAEHKKKLILEAGADLALNLNEDWKAAVMDYTSGKGADVVYDSIGSTLPESLQVARTGGQVVFFGMSGGRPVPVDPVLLMDGSKTLTGGDLWSYLDSAEQRLQRSAELFNWISSGQLRPAEPVLFPLAQGSEAHNFLENGKAAGKILLVTERGMQE